MEKATMGKVVVSALIENLPDIWDAEHGRLLPDQVRRVEVHDALVDTGATGLSMPRRLVAQLGLYAMRKRPARPSTGIVELQIYGAVRLTIQGRDCLCDVAELPDECPVLIGQVPLEILDFVVDPVGQRLIGNPDHGGVQMIEVF